MKCHRGQHSCAFVLDERDEDDDRIVTKEHCIWCGRLREGFYAKREECGPVGYWKYIP